jgi:Xaa-Pro aminopeptidase
MSLVPAANNSVILDTEMAMNALYLTCITRLLTNLGVIYILYIYIYMTEYVPDAYKRREFMTGFRGSAGTAVVTATDAWLWTDSRYWNEAGLQLDATCWTLQKSGQAAVPTLQKWLADLAVQSYQKKNVDQQQQVVPLRVGMDPYVHAASFSKDFKTALEEAANEAGLEEDAESKLATVGVLIAIDDNLVDSIWGDIRPPIPASAFRVHPDDYAGVSVEDKIISIRKEMESKKATLTVFCTLDDVAYFLNLRCKGDIDTSPVGIAYCTLSVDEVVTLFCDPRKIKDPQVQEHLKGVTIKPYADIVQDIAKHCETKGNKVWLDTSRANFALSNSIPPKSLLDAQNAITPMKACKNEAEIKGMRQAHVVDGAAMANFMAWLEDTIVVQGLSVSEVQVAERLLACRAEQPGFIEVSFPTIAGVGSNGAIIHYRAQNDSDLLKHLDITNPILIDSGGQYSYGTTDVTRTWHFGTPTAEFVDCYTRVLKGHIGLDQMIFPENTPGFVLDVYARRWLWDAGKDYGHGTGHGVGAALNVHEGPMSISPRWMNKEVLKKGMVVSNEPGYYEDGNFGIRIENLIEIQYVKPEDNEEAKPNEGDAPSGEKKFLKFQKLTMIPIQKNLINLDLMTSGELDWLDAYHAQVLEKVSPYLTPDSPAMTWLQKMCQKIDR